MSTRGTWFMRDRPVVIWLFVAVLVSLVHPFFADSRWLMVHLVALGALTHSVMVWSVHFADALLKTKSIEPRRRQSLRLGLFHVGAVAVFAGVPLTLWPLTIAGAAAISVAVAWHGVMLVRRLRVALPGRFRITVRYYVAAAAMLPVGATFGVLLARGLGDPWHGRLLVAHTMTNLLGWIGLSILGTLVTLWPTMLRTRMAEGSERTSRRALPVLLVGLAAVIAGPLVGLEPLAAAGIACYLAGALVVYWPILVAARNRPPYAFPTLSVGAGLLWLPIGLVTMGVALLSRGWTALAGSYGNLTVIFLVGFALQVLFGALSYLLPVVLGGGPSVLRATMKGMERWGTWRVVVVNLGLAACLLPVPSLVRVVLSAVTLVALASTLVFILTGLAAGIRAKRAAQASPPARGGAPTHDRAERALTLSWSRPQLIAGVTVIAVGAALGVGLDPAAAGFPTAGADRPAAGDTSAVTATGEVTTVDVTMSDMRFHPASVEVPVGNELVINLTNADEAEVHDLVLADGANSGRLAPGESTTLEVGVVGADIDGWCSIVGHRQMGMVFEVVATGGSDGMNGPGDMGGPGGMGGPGDMGGMHGGTGSSSDAGDSSSPIDFMAPWPEDFTGFDPELPPLAEETVHEVTMRVTDVPTEVAPGVRQVRWTYNGSSTGPTLHGRVGDTFKVTLINDGTMGHSIDFHASELAPDEPMRDIAPGESLEYTFTAKRAGMWMYHCGTMPMTAHIAAGMAGAIVIEPPGLPEVDRSYVITQSELYLDTAGAAGTSGDGDAAEVDATRAATEDVDAVMFNGFVNQYVDNPLQARVGERVRFWLLDVGPNRPLSFHIVGAQFDTVYKEGTYLLKDGRGPLDPPGYDAGGSQALDLLAAQGGFVETVFVEAGHYSMINHVMADAERGARGIVEVSE
ncbi:multicopper oxidase domain-containing protein [Pseudactinotalea sp. HY160]|uniref:multicopper oxidase domain-containing protein n=1 Tax=Pseudactinotalea sp. HY160 TaxID=2654490 RepID=UPI0013110856|nr:multicopper oxidase domain-containing protein [Pseudactinotalea sp. HY160]